MFSNKEDNKVEAEITGSSTSIGKGTVLYGDIETHGNLRIEGKVEGGVTTKSKVVLGKSSVVVGDIKAQNAEIEGHVSGTVKVTDVLILKSTSKIDGDIVTNKLIVESGSHFNGGCQMGAKPQAKSINTSLKEKRSEPINSQKTFKSPAKAGTV